MTGAVPRPDDDGVVALPFSGRRVMVRLALVSPAKLHCPVSLELHLNGTDDLARSLDQPSCTVTDARWSCSKTRPAKLHLDDMDGLVSSWRAGLSYD